MLRAKKKKLCVAVPALAGCTATEVWPRPRELQLSYREEQIPVGVTSYSELRLGFLRICQGCAVVAGKLKPMFSENKLAMGHQAPKD